MYPFKFQKSQEELDRFINAMIHIYDEVLSVKNGMVDKTNNVLKNSPHTLADVITWNKPYTIEEGCFPAQHLKKCKVFPSVNRVDDVYGDRNFFCSCFDFNQFGQADGNTL